MIPRFAHTIWIGSKPYPESAMIYEDDMRRVCRNYSVALWDDNAIAAIENRLLPSSREMLLSKLNPVVKSDIMRYEVLRLYGGFYLDTDVEVFRSFDDFLDMDFVCALESPTHVGSAVLGCIPNHPVTCAMLDAIYRNFLSNGIPRSAYQQLTFGGPYLLTDVIKSQGIHPLPRKLFYQCQRSEKNENQYTIHYFLGSKKGGWCFDECAGKVCATCLDRSKCTIVKEGDKP